MNQALKVVVNWAIFLAIVFLIWLAFNNWSLKLPGFPEMPGIKVLFFSLALAFSWVEGLRLGSVKPFNCVKCLTGWFALALAFLFHTQFWYLYLPAGFFVGAVFSAIKMRWL